MALQLDYDARTLLALAGEARWAELRASGTQAALARGVLGAPSYFVGEELFRGQDRLDFLGRRPERG